MDAADSLRDAATAFAPDARTTHSLEDRHQVISQFVLDAHTPEAIRIHFETAKNVFLYAWYVYRFHMVAEHYVFSTLEMALRERLYQVGLLSRDSGGGPGMSKLLKVARDNKLVSNERFVGRERWILSRAQRRYSHEMMMKMVREGINEAEVDYSNVEPTAEDIAFDWLDNLIKHLPDQRNIHAHGTDMLYATVLWSFEVVAELVNQLFTDPGLKGGTQTA
jgi:hypothetical protein